MKNRWIRLTAVLGAAMLVVCQNGVVEVRAQEPMALEDTQQQDEEKEKTGDEEKNPGTDQPTTPEENEKKEGSGAEGTEEKKNLEDATPADDIPETTETRKDGAEETTEQTGEENKLTEEGEEQEKVTPEDGQKTPEDVKDAAPAALDETPVDEAAADERTADIQPVTNLRWEDGKAVFYNPNTVKVQFMIHIFKDGSYPGGMTTTNHSGRADGPGDVTVDLSYCAERYGAGTYTYKVVTFADGASTDYQLNGAGVCSEEESAENSDMDNPGQGGSGEEKRELLAPTNLEWNDRWQVRFYNPNERAVLIAYLYGPDGELVEGAAFSDGRVHGKESVIYDFYHSVEQCGENGTYTFAVEAVYWNGDVRAMSEQSGASNSFTKPSEQLPKPEITVSKSGVVRVSPIDGYTLGDDYGFDYQVFEGDERTFQWGNNLTEVDLGKFAGLREGRTYLIKVKTLSRKIDKVLSSDYTEYTLEIPRSKKSSASSDEEKDTSSDTSYEAAAPVVEAWKPVTPDEIKRYAAYSREKVEYTADGKNAYPVSIQNAMQGRMCFDSFEAVLGDWTIGRTYNILPSGRIVYRMDSKARITLNIPKALQKAGREYKMICVTEKGLPVELKDLDSEAGTITFETDSYYAFALVYRDPAVAK